AARHFSSDGSRVRTDVCVPVKKVPPCAIRWGHYYSGTNKMFVKNPNCLIRNLSEIGSLPHLRNLSEMPTPERRRRRDGADDERAQSRNGGDGGVVSPGEQETERAAARRADCRYWLQ